MEEYEYTHTKLAENFWNGCVEKNNIGVEKDKTLKIADENGQICEESIKSIRYCLYRALKDFTDRTTTKSYPKQPLGPANKLNRLEGAGFLANFIEYFKSRPKDLAEFDEWHHTMCEKFLDIFKNDYKDLKYGKAQKIVNMTFKNIYCLDGAEKYEEYFEHCHVPLDSLVLEWVCRTGLKKNYPRNDPPRLAKCHCPSWSNLLYKEGEYPKKEWSYYYIDILTWFRKYFLMKTKDSDNRWTPFKAEFVIWPQIQFELAAEGLYSQLFAIDKDNGSLGKPEAFKKKSVQEKIDYFKTISFDHVDFIKYDL